MLFPSNQSSDPPSLQDMRRLVEVEEEVSQGTSESERSSAARRVALRLASVARGRRNSPPRSERLASLLPFLTVRDEAGSSGGSGKRRGGTKTRPRPLLVVDHSSSSPLACCKLDVAAWNGMGFETVSEEVDGTVVARGRLWPHVIHTDRASPPSPSAGRSLLSLCATRMARSPDTSLVLFHGTAGESEASLRSSIRPVGDGALGNGFYVTTNPNEAKAYACEAEIEAESGKVVVLELLLTGADKVREGVHFSRNPRRGFECQFVLRRQFFSDMARDLSILRVHTLDVEFLLTSGITDEDEVAQC